MPYRTHYVLISLLTILTLTTGQAGEAVITMSNIGATVAPFPLRVASARIPSFTFKRQNVLPVRDTVIPLDHLYYTVDGATTLDLAVTWTVHVWRTVAAIASPNGSANADLSDAHVTLSKLGALAGKPRLSVDVSPWRIHNNELQVADSATIRVMWTSSTAPEPVVVQEGDWYDLSEPIIRFTTARDGIAMVTAADIVSRDGRFIGTPLDDLKLLRQDKEQALGIIDADASTTLTSGDTLLLQGRRPAGDTTWFDIEDTVSVFFLTRVSGGQHRRLTPFTSTSFSAELQQLEVDRHIELDTGYYSLGYANSGDLGDYNSDHVWLEGFYWDALNANSYERLTYRFPLSGAPNGSTTITTYYNSTTDAVGMTPDTRGDLTLNGSESTFLETDGPGAFSLSIDHQHGTFGNAGLMSVKLFATGSDSLRSNPRYFSELLLDWIRVRSNIIPVLDSGRLIANHGPLTTNHELLLHNARSSKGFWIDTVHGTWGRLWNAHEPTETYTTIRAGMSYRDRDWIRTPITLDTLRASAVFNDSVVSIENLYGIALVTPSQVVTGSAGTDMNDLASAIRDLKSDDPYAIFNTGVSTASSVRQALQQLGIDVPASKYWMMSGAVAREGSVSTSDTDPQLSSTTSTPNSKDTRYELRTVLPASPSGSTIIYADLDGLERVSVSKTRLGLRTKAVAQTDLIMVTHAVHRQQAERLAAHRRTYNGIKVSVVDIDSVLEDFGYGQRSSEALRQYLAWYYMAAPEPKPATVLFVGNASWDPRLAIKGGNVGARRADQIPTYGRPSSDYYFGLLDDVNDKAVPELIVGRLPVLSETDGRAMVDKIIMSDTSVFRPWMRKWLYVGGGSEPEGLCDMYKYVTEDPFGSGFKVSDPPLCFDTTTLCRYEAPPNAGYIIKQEISNGLQWMNFIGHGATDIFDITGWEPNELTNTGRYGILATFACQTGAFSNPSVPCKNAQYLTEPDRGFAAAVGGTGWAYTQTISQLHYVMHEVMNLGRRRDIGSIVYESKIPFAMRGDQDGINTAMQYCILGDPLMKIHLDTAVEARLDARDVVIATPDGATQITDEDEVANVRVRVNSVGIGTTTPLTVRMRHTFAGVTDSADVTLADGLCLEAVAAFEVAVKDKAGEHLLTFIADPFSVLGDDVSDNTITTSFTVLPRSLLPLQPVMHGNITRTGAFVRVIDPISSVDKPQNIFFAYTTSRSLDDTAIIVRSSDADDAIRRGSVIDWQPALPSSLPAGPIWLAAWAVDPETERSSAILWIPLVVIDGDRVVDTLTSIPASRLVSVLNENTEFDSSRNVIELKRITRQIFLRSSAIPTSNLAEQPVLEMNVGDVTYVRNPFYRGINLIVLGQHDTVPRAIRRYDTWKDPLPPEAGHNGFSSDCLKFLRDSVGAQERVMFAACNESFTGFYQDGNIDSLRSILKEYGSSFADSLRELSSWVMFGWKGRDSGTADEAWKGYPDSMVTITVPVEFSESSGTIIGQVLGPAREWRQITLEQADSGVRASLVGRDRNGATLFLADLQEGETSWKPDDGATNIVEIQVNWSLYAVGSDTTSSIVRGVSASFIPAHELLIEPDQVTALPDDLLRGDTTLVTVTVKNADPRDASPVAPLVISIVDSNGTVAAQQTVSVPTLVDSEYTEFSVKLPTNAATASSAVVVALDPQRSISQFYTFNDVRIRPLTIREDATPPAITAYAEGLNVTAGGYVVREPLITVFVHDNSKLPINDPTRLVVFVNGQRIRDGIVDEFEFLPTDSCRTRYADTTLRAAMVFRYPLDEGQNNLIVRASDATGNPAELESELWVTNTTEITAVVPSPNPTSSGTTFRISLKTSEPVSPATVAIFDVDGRSIRRLSTQLELGQATVYWDGRGASGESLPTGIYAYRLEVENPTSGAAADTSGTLMILR